MIYVNVYSEWPNKINIYVSRNSRKKEVDQPTKHRARHTNLREKSFDVKEKPTDTIQVKHSLYIKCLHNAVYYGIWITN